MSNRLRLRQSVVGSSMVRGRRLPDDMDLYGRFNVQLVDRFGNPLTDKLLVPNGICTAAKTALLESWFNTGTRYSPWFIGLIDDSNYTTAQATDVMGSHTGWSEFTAYSFGSTNDTTNRQSWGQGTASGAAITNGTQLVYTFTQTGSVAGIFVTSNNARNNWASGMLWSTALFASPLSVVDGDELKVSYTVSA